jgi:hypothetical protein
MQKIAQLAFWGGWGTTPALPEVDILDAHDATKIA